MFCINYPNYADITFIYLVFFDFDFNCIILIICVIELCKEINK